MAQPKMDGTAIAPTGNIPPIPAVGWNSISLLSGPPSVKAAGVMPTYSIMLARGYPAVGGGFNKVLIQDVLQKREHFDGLVVSDFNITQDCDETCQVGRQPGVVPNRVTFGKPWGVETLTRDERIVRSIEAGVDQIGDESEFEPIIAAVRGGRLSMARIDRSVRKDLLIKFRQGLFENPYADLDRTEQIVGQAAFKAEALATRERSLVLLENASRSCRLRQRASAFSCAVSPRRRQPRQVSPSSMIWPVPISPSSAPMRPISALMPIS